MVVLFVSALVSTVVLVNFGDFTSKTSFENEALNVALEVKKAQVYGMNGKEVSAGSFGVPYGISIGIDNPNSFIFFSDNNQNNIYNPPAENISTLKINDGFIIDDICVNTIFCEKSYSTILNGFTILFKRPNPDAIIYTISRSNGNPISLYSNISIKIKRISDGSIKTINVTNTGQIYIN